MLVFFLCCVWGICESVIDQDKRPVIGIITHPQDTLVQTDSVYSYIAASYVKWAESGGADVVPILFDSSEEKLKDVFGKINGIIFPGGSAGLSLGNDYMKGLQVLYDLVIESSSKGDSVPLWGTCMGMQALAILTSKNDSVLLRGVYDSYNLSLPLDFVKNESRIFDIFPKDIFRYYQTMDITLNQHHDGVDMKNWNKNSLGDFYDLISTNVDRNGKDFVSTFEAKNFPIYAAQWHPEKVSFENEPEAINADYRSILANLAPSIFLVNEAKKNNHKYSTEEELKGDLIYNNYAYYDQKQYNSYFIQNYYFSKFDYAPEDNGGDWMEMVIFICLGLGIIAIVFLLLLCSALIVRCFPRKKKGYEILVSEKKKEKL